MREFELYGTVRAIVSVCDSVNYITEPEELEEVFRLVNNYLDPKGVFLFDFNTVYKYKEVMGDTVIAEDRGECSFIWDNFYYEEERINEYDLTLFIQEDASEDLYRRYQETHYQRGYTLEEMKDWWNVRDLFLRRHMTQLHTRNRQRRVRESISLPENPGNELDTILE